MEGLQGRAVLWRAKSKGLLGPPLDNHEAEMRRVDYLTILPFLEFVSLYSEAGEKKGRSTLPGERVAAVLAIAAAICFTSPRLGSLEDILEASLFRASTA